MSLIRVMTFNLRNSRADDGPDSWPWRKEATLAAIRSLTPDIMGIQEGLSDQVQFLEEGLPEYDRWGQGRHGGDKDEHGAIFFRRDRLEMAERGDFWLSDTPSIPGSRSWGNNCVRMATWGVFVLKDCQQSLLVVNTHLDHESQPAREKGAALIKEFIQRKRGKLPVVLTGDLNAGPANPAIRLLTEPPAALVDSYAAAQKLRFGSEHRGNLPSDRSAGSPSTRDQTEAEVLLQDDHAYFTRPGTFHGFTGQGLSHIDYILITPDIRLESYSIITDQFIGRWPSDHFPVLVELKLPSSCS